MSMDQDLARMFGTDKLASQDQQKLAALDHFAKVASIAGIEFRTDEQAAAWVNTWDDFQKLAYGNNIALHEYGLQKQAEMFVDWYNRSVAEAGPSQEVAAASQYLQKIASETVSTQQQFDAAAQFGKIAAHAYVNEITGLMKGAADDKDTIPHYTAPELQTHIEPKTRRRVPRPEPTFMPSSPPGLPFWKRNRAAGAKGPKNPRDVSPDPHEGIPRRTQHGVEVSAPAVQRHKGYGERISEKAQELWNHKHRNKALGAGAALALAGGAYGAKKIYDKKKEEGEGKEAFDLLAAKEAHAILVNEGFDGNEAAARLNLALQKEALELTSDEVKLAAAQDPEYGLLTRAVELMEIAGYEVAGL